MKVEILKQKEYRFLWINDYLWMWDIPVERKMQKKLANEAYGDVLVVGYGLGIIQKYILQNDKVNTLITSEKYVEVLEACKKEYGRTYGCIILKDFYNFHTTSGFDCVIGDIWEEIAPEGLNEYKKFKNKAQELLKPNGKIIAWGKDYFEYLINKEKT